MHVIYDIDHTISGKNVTTDSSFWQYGDYADIRGVSWRKASKLQCGGRKRRFSVRSVTTSSESLEKTKLLYGNIYGGAQLPDLNYRTSYMLSAMLLQLLSQFRPSVTRVDQ